ncbi:MAG TPA: tripartite tricarboxylate transporter substrate binding protein [Alphaproteobacteria bacterium]|nr:tripartite tricarboxylate transporter substrate binding protein [Alphaproteobacteria bacterium]
MIRLAIIAIAAALSVALKAPAGQAAITDLEIVVPAAPGGGYDITARAMQSALTGAKLVPNVTISYEPGRGGVLALDKLGNEWRADESIVMTTGFVMLGAISAARAGKLLDPVTPIALLADEPEVIVVPKDSRYKTLLELLAAVRATPGAVAFAGGSSGGIDHILIGLIGAQIEVSPALMPYLPHAGGGDSLVTLLRGQATAAVGGVSEFLIPLRDGRLRALAVSSRTRVATVDAPTMAQAGINLSLLNWRGLIAPPDVGRAHQRELSQLIGRMVKTPQWQASLKQYGWTDQFLPDERFGDYMGGERKKIDAAVQALRLGP